MRMPLYKHRILFLVLLFVLSFLMVGQLALAAEPIKTGAERATQGLDKTAELGYGKNMSGTADLPTTIGRVIGAVLAFLGVAFFALMVVGGYMWMFSMGNEQKSAKAKEILIAAVIGLVIVLTAYVITMLIAGIFSESTGVAPL